MITVKKSVYDNLINKHSNRILNHFKKELLKILEESEVREEKIISKAIEDYDNSMARTFLTEYSINKSRGYGIGTVREWKGHKYRKIAPGKWRKIYDVHSRGANQSIAIIKKKIENAKSIDELLQLVMENTNRFMDSDGKLLPIVEELKNAVNERKSKLNTSKTTFNNISDISKERENFITSVIKFPNQGVLKGNNKSIQNYFKLFIGDKLVQKEYKTVLRKILNKDVTTENVIERVSEFLISKGIPNKKVVNAANYIEKRIDLFKNYHKEYNKRDTSKNILNKARNFDDYENIVNKYGIEVSDDLKKRAMFEDTKKCSIGLLEFLDEFPLVQKLIPRIGITRENCIMCVQFINEKPIEISFGSKFIIEDGTKKEEDKNIYFHAGDEQLNAESFGYHEGAHVLAALLKNNGMYSDVEICKKAYEQIRQTQLNGISYEDAKLTISDYAEETDNELFAEAFADVYQYGENASPFSKKIVQLAKMEYNAIKR